MSAAELPKDNIPKDGIPKEEKPQIEEPDIDVPLMCMRVRYWWYLVIFCQGVIGVFMFATLGTRKWVRQGDEDSEWQGGLLECTFCHLKSDWHEETYDDLKSDECDADGDSHEAWCTMFEDLQSAGGVFVFFELLSFGLLGLWIARVCLALCSKRFLPEIVAYIFPAVAFLAHTIGLIIWAAVSKSGFNADCEDFVDGSDRTDTCSTNGPALAVLTCLLYVFFGLLYGFVFRNRRGFPNNK
mmetsp:Transcript_23981/g.42483  ORF Transcript_23981/g.42483 Transcript_23981/m.42483 type:complete len:241 (-) Transcript_23981:2199-2921(-)